MKKFVFTLGRVLDFKTQMLDKEKNTLAQLRLEKRELELKIEEQLQAFDAVNAEMLEKATRGITVLEIRGFQFQLESLRNQIKLLRAQGQIMDAGIETQLGLVVRMTQDVSGLDKLKEKQRQEYNHDVMRADELEIAEFVSGKLIREKEALGAC